MHNTITATPLPCLLRTSPRNALHICCLANLLTPSIITELVSHKYSVAPSHLAPVDTTAKQCQSKAASHFSYCNSIYPLTCAYTPLSAIKKQSKTVPSLPPPWLDMLAHKGIRPGQGSASLQRQRRLRSTAAVDTRTNIA